MKQNLHTHTVFCDGEDTPEAFVKEAIARGFDSIGFSGHGYAFFDDEYCMSREGTKIPFAAHYVSEARDSYGSTPSPSIGMKGTPLSFAHCRVVPPPDA